METTYLEHWHYIDGVHTHDVWELPPEGTNIWCTGWKRNKFIIPLGDGYTIKVDGIKFHRSKAVRSMHKYEKKGCAWGLENVEMVREQKINDEWVRVEV